VNRHWAFIDTAYHNAAWNMAFDECLINWHSKGIIPPTLRFYGWSQPSLSVGYFQNVTRSIDFEALQRHQCQFVRRLTGGSAVLHDNELTYSLVISENDPDIPMSVQKAYQILTRGVLEGYQNLGIPAEFEQLNRNSKNDRTAICFEKTAIYELVVNGKKLSGNAQTRKKGVLMQHGSIPITMDIKLLFHLFQFPSEKARERKQHSFSSKALTINQLTDQVYQYERLVKPFKDGFEKGLKIKFHPLQLTDSQYQEVAYLAKEKYESPAWNINSYKERATIAERVHS